jgi:hypothetical protein
MPEVLDFVNGRPVRRGTDSSADLLPSVPEEEARPKPKAKGKQKPKPKPKPKNPVQQLQNDLLYEFNQLRKNPIGGALNMADRFVGRGPTAGPMGFIGSQALTGVAGAADNIQRMGYSMWQRHVQKRPQADPSRGFMGQLIDAQADTTYRLLGQTPPSQMTRRERDIDMFRRSVALNAMLSAIPGGKALQATTRLGGAVKGGLAFGLGEAASQFLDDNTGGGFMDLPNSVLPKNMQLPGGLGDKAGQLDMVDSALATFGGNVAGGLAVGGAIGLAARMLPGTMRWLRGSRLKAEEVEAGGRLTTAGVLEDNGDGATRPGPAAATAAPQKPATFAEADAAMRQRLGEPAAADPDAATRAELAQVEERLAQLQREGAAPASSEPLAEVLGVDRPLEEFDPALDPWADFDPELPEATDVLKTLDQLDPAVIRAMDEADGSITEMVEQAQQAQQAVPLNPALRFDRVAAPTDKVSRLYLEGAGESEGWDQVIEALNPADLRSLAHPSNSPELAARIESLTGKEWNEFTAGDIRVGMRALSKEGRTVLAERLTGKEFMDTEEIAVDPERFQFKQGTDGQGQQTGASLSEEEFWNPRAEDVIEVWDDPADGKTYVVNGHNRLALAKRLGIPSLPVRRIAATKPGAARAFGAIANISQGQGSAFDAAKFIRESGLTTPEQLKQAGMTGERSWAKDGLALSKLPDDLYRSAVDGDISLRKAVIIGESGLPEPGMRMLAAEVRNNPNIPDWELKEIGAMTGSSPAVKSRQGTLEGMEGFGLDEGARAKVRLVRAVEEALRKDAKVFGGVAKAAGQLEGKAANTIDRAGSKAVAEEANTGLAAFTRLKYQSGEVSDRLNRAAQQIADGAQPGAVARQVADEMPAILQREMDNAMGKTPVAEVDPDQVDLFAPPEQAADAVPPPETAAQIEARKMRLVGRALREGEARPNTTPIPELSEGPRVDPSEALADIEARGGIEPDSPAMKALEDEIRLIEEQALQDAAARQDAVEAMKDAYGYDELTFEEKKGLGMTEEWEPIENMPKIADMVDRANAEMAQTDANVYRRVGKSIDAQREGLEQLAPAPVKPQPLTLAQAAQPEFTLPDTLTKAAPRYGRFTVAFDSDLDRAAYILQNDLKKPSKAAPAFREAVQAAGLNPAAVAAHGAKVKAAIKEIAKGNSAGQLRVPRQPWDAGEMASAPDGRAANTAFHSAEETETLAKMSEALIRKVAGDEVAVRFSMTYPQIRKPKAWGGDGAQTVPQLGFYRFSEDLIQINGMGTTSLPALVETSYHEAFHRIQFMALGPKDMKVLDGAIARLKVGLGARIDGIAYFESQAVAFQRYARAKAMGDDPIAALVGADLLRLGRIPTKLERNVTAIIAAFDRIADFVERSINAIRGNGFESVKGIFERAYRGSLSESLPDDVVRSSERMGTIRRWHNFDATRQKLGEEISAVQAQIADIQQRAAKEGC